MFGHNCDFIKVGNSSKSTVKCYLHSWQVHLLFPMITESEIYVFVSFHRYGVVINLFTKNVAREPLHAVNYEDNKEFNFRENSL